VETCNPTLTDLLMNSEHTPKTRSVYPEERYQRISEKLMVMVSRMRKTDKTGSRL